MRRPLHCRFGHGEYSYRDPVCPGCAKAEDAARRRARFTAVSPQRTGPEQDVPFVDTVLKVRDPRWWEALAAVDDYETGVFGDVTYGGDPPDRDAGWRP